MKPLIGLTSYYVEAAEFEKNRPRGAYDQDYVMTSADYVKSLEMAGGIPIVLPSTSDASTIKSYVSRVDGLLFAGGEDIHPKYYGQSVEKGMGRISPLRDSFEWALLEEAIAQDKPIFGICRGLQLINAFYGGTLFQDLNKMDFTSIEHSYVHGPKYSPCHVVEVYVGTHLYDMVQQAKIGVNTKHHQSIDVLGDGLIVTSKAMDGVIEGIEDPSKRFLMAVQWHPEMMAENEPLQRKIFDGFVRHCKK